MFGLKGKALFFFIITTILLSGLGVYFFVSINGLMKKVEVRFEPKEQTNLLKSLTLEVNNLNNQYLSDTIQLTDHYIDSIILNVDESIKKIQSESRKANFEHYDNLDTIPEMLYELKRKNFELKELRSDGENNFIFSLEQVIQDEFKDKLLSEKDSIIVTHQITSYIKENKIFVEKPKLNEDDGEDEGNFFQRLFKSKEKSKKIIDNEVESEIIKLDTTVQQKMDTVNQMNLSNPTMDLITLFDKIQFKRIRYINNVQSVEKDIYELNYGINKNVEDIINDFILQQYVSYESYLTELKDETKQQSTILLITILGFTIFSIILIFRFFKDINRSEEYQNTLKLKEVQAKRETEEKQRFLNTMSHEIRTPLTSIIGYVDLLEGDSKNIRAIKSSANYLYQMTNEILDIAKINLGVIEINEGPINLTKSLQEIKDNFIPHLESKGLEYEFDIPEEPLYVHTDGQRVQQILYNLIHNAIKFTSEGHIKLELDIQNHDSYYHLVFRVIDSGVGMDKQEQIKVFEDFHQAGTHKSKMKGTGLGLGIVQKLVHLLSGEIYLNSEKRKGTTFVLSFDFEKVRDKDLQNINQENIDKDVFKNLFTGKSILIVDDDVLITGLYQKIITPTNAQIVVFNNPKEALPIAMNGTFDLLIIDYRMPEMSGYEFLETLREQNNSLPKTIVSTANAMLDDEDKRKLESFDKIIFKPIKRDLFLRHIFEVLGIEIDSNHNEKESEIEENNKISNIEETPNEELQLDALKNYVGNEPLELVEILEVIIAENDKSLTAFSKAIEEVNHHEIAFIIHQLSSRFAQTDASLIVNTNDIECDLKKKGRDFSMDRIKELFEFWSLAHEKINIKLKQLKEI